MEKSNRNTPLFQETGEQRVTQDLYDFMLIIITVMEAGESRLWELMHLIP
jgi:hypothetical protein